MGIVDQLWAEATLREAQGESITLSREMWDCAAAAQQQRVAEDAYSDVLNGAFGDRCGKVPMEAIKRLLGIQTARMSPHDARRIKSAMGDLGWVYGTYWLYDRSRGSRRPKKGFARGNESESKIEFSVDITDGGEPKVVQVDGDRDPEIPF